MRKTILFRLAWYFIKKELRTALSYRFSFASQGILIFFTLAIFYYLGQWLKEHPLKALAVYGTDYFTFVLLGLAFSNYLTLGLYSLAESIKREQTLGTLEVLQASPLTDRLLLIYLSLSTLLEETLSILFYFLIGIIFFKVEFHSANWTCMIVFVIVTFLVYWGLGMISAALIIFFKKGNPIDFILNGIFVLLGGVYFPIEILPNSLQTLADYLPLTYALHALRMSILQGTDLFSLTKELLILSGFALIFLISGILSVNLAFKKARVSGNLGYL